MSDPYVPMGRREQQIYDAGAMAQRDGAKIKDCPFKGNDAYVWMCGWTWQEANG